MADPKIAIERTMKLEDSTLSGKVTHDAGGRTRFGIAQKFHPDLPEEFFTGPKEEALAEAEQIMETDYWNVLHLSEVESQDVANKLHDMAVNMGVHQAGVYAQRAVNSQLLLLNEDGNIGPKTLAAINAIDPQVYYGLLCQFSAWHYRHIAANNPSQAENLNGWLKRAEA